MCDQNVKQYQKNGFNSFVFVDLTVENSRTILIGFDAAGVVYL